MECTAVFLDYSDGGALFLGGRMNYYDYYPVVQPDIPVYQSYFIHGTVIMAGSYNGYLTFHLAVSDLPDGFKVRGDYFVQSVISETEGKGYGGSLTPRKEIDGVEYQGWQVIELP